MSISFPTHLQASASGFLWGSPISRNFDVENGGLALAGDVGWGWKFGSSSFSAIFGAGAHVNMVTVYSPKDSESDDFISSALGVGVQAIQMLEVSESVFVNGALKLAYGFVDLGRHPNVAEDWRYSGGWILGASIGVGFGF